MKIRLKTVKILYVLFLGLMLFYVLYIFEAFGIDQGVSYSGHDFLTRSILFGLLNSFVFFVLEFGLSKKINPKTLFQKIAWIFAQLLIGGTSIFLLFNYFWNWQEWSLNAYILLILEYFSIMILPIALFQFGINDRFKLTLPNSEVLIFQSENGKDVIQVKPEFFLFMRSDKNYLEIYFLEQEKIKTHLIRNRLKVIEDNYEDSPFLKRCHRSFLVNPIQIDKIIKNKGKSEIHIQNQIIPISDSFLESFMN